MSDQQDQSERKLNIFEAMTAIQNEIGYIPKDKTRGNSNQKYRSSGAVLDALSPLFAKYKVFLAPNTKNETLYCEPRETADGKLQYYASLEVRYVLYAQDGSSIEITGLGEATSSGGNPITAAKTNALKQALEQVFLIISGDENDHDQERNDYKSGGNNYNRQSTRTQNLSPRQILINKITSLWAEFARKGVSVKRDDLTKLSDDSLEVLANSLTTQLNQ